MRVNVAFIAKMVGELTPDEQVLLQMLAQTIMQVRWATGAMQLTNEAVPRFYILEPGPGTYDERYHLKVWREGEEVKASSSLKFRALCQGMAAVTPELQYNVCHALYTLQLLHMQQKGGG